MPMRIPPLDSGNDTRYFLPGPTPDLDAETEARERGLLAEHLRGDDRETEYNPEAGSGPDVAPQGTPNLLPPHLRDGRAHLFFVNDGDEPTSYVLDLMAEQILDGRRAHPEASFSIAMPIRDRVLATALLLMALQVLDPDA